MVGELDETYLSELQTRELPEGQQSLFEDYQHTPTTIAVVSKPTGGIVDACDEFKPELGMPESTLEEFQRLRGQMNEISGVEEHNKAFDKLSLGPEYRQHLKLNGDAKKAVEELIERLKDGEDITVVCFEGEDKRCHRHILVDEIKSRLRREGVEVY